MFETGYANDNHVGHDVPRRARSAGVAKREAVIARKKSTACVRARRGIQTIIPSLWRRAEPGTNRISNLGVWRRGTRRAAPRPNREGLTDWHRPYRALPVCANGTALLVS
jgi:hypothetical protein